MRQSKWPALYGARTAHWYRCGSEGPWCRGLEPKAQGVQLMKDIPGEGGGVLQTRVLCTPSPSTIRSMMYD